MRSCDNSAKLKMITLYALSTCWLIERDNSVWKGHGTIIQTGITCKKIPCYMRTQLAAGGLLLKMLKYFKVMLNIF